MSTLFVDTINEQTTGNGIQIPGHVVQIQHRTYNGGSGATTTSWTATNAYVDITPKYTNSKILVCSRGTSYVAGGGAYFTWFKRIGNSSFINQNNVGEYSNTHSSGGMTQLTDLHSGSYSMMPSYFSMIDTATHTTTDVLRYNIYAKTASGSTTGVYWGAGSVDTTDIWAMEIAQ